MPSIPMTTQWIFDTDSLAPDTIVLYKLKGNTHHFHGLVRTVSEEHITIFNGFVVSGFDIFEVEDGEVTIYPLLDKGARTEYQAEVFDVDHLPLTSILMLEGRAPLLVVDVDPFELTVKTATGSEQSIIPTDIDHTTDTIIFPQGDLNDDA